MTIATPTPTYTNDVSQKEHKRRIWAWTMYDWANSAFATTIMAAVLPVYFSQVAGATLPSATVATAYWSTGLSISILIVAIFSPILGTISDIKRGKKGFLAFFAGMGIMAVALLILVDTGDWVLAGILAIIGRIGFSGANVFYDSLLPHVAREDEQDRVSTRGYAMGYLGGGLLLAINVLMIQFLPGTWGPRLSFLSVAIWWAVFSIPLFRIVPEPPAATMQLDAGKRVIVASFNRLKNTFLDIKRYSELFKLLLAFFIYNDGIGTIIGVAAIYGAELGFGSIELILALLLVQFVGIPYSLVFGRLPSKTETRRSFYLAFILFNMIALPLVGIIGAHVLPPELSGAPPAPFLSTDTALGEGVYSSDNAKVQYSGNWQTMTVSANVIGAEEDALLTVSEEPGAAIDILFNGQKVKLNFQSGMEHGVWQVYLDGEPLEDQSTNQLVIVDAFNPTMRYMESITLEADSPGEHILRLVNTDQKNPESQGFLMTLISIEVLPGVRQSNLGIVIGLIFIVELVGLLLSFFIGARLLKNIAELFDTKRSILLALSVYAVVAVWGFVLDSVVEFWFLAWMVAVVQGGSQALTRSLYSVMSPKAKSGEFFGLFGIMEKFSAVIGPLLFAAAGVIFGSSRPAVLSLIIIFIIGGYLLTRVDVEEGKRVARLEDAEYFGN
jgi:MFS transporter, UMF1 family